MEEKKVNPNPEQASAGHVKEGKAEKLEIKQDLTSSKETIFLSKLEELNKLAKELYNK